MIDLYENRNGRQVLVATVTLKDVCHIGIRTFFKVQELTGRKVVYVREVGKDEKEDQ